MNEIRLYRAGGRPYIPELANFSDIPPHHIVIQGKYVAVVNAKMKAARMKSLGCKLRIAGCFAIHKIKEVDLNRSSLSSSSSSANEPDDIEN